MESFLAFWQSCSWWLRALLVLAVLWLSLEVLSVVHSFNDTLRSRIGNMQLWMPAFASLLEPDTRCSSTKVIRLRLRGANQLLTEEALSDGTD